MEAVQVRVGKILRRKRLELGLSQREVATAAHVTREYVSQLETGAREATLGTLREVVHALGLSLVDVLIEAKDV